MASFTANDIEIAYDDIIPAGGDDGAIVLIHGYASNRDEGWRRTGWYGAFERRRMRVIALDQRGHGQSAKLHDAKACGREQMAGDVLALMDHLGVGRAALFGYSMGTRTAIEAALAAPERFTNLILGGVGGRLLEPEAPGGRAAMAEAMLADDPETIAETMPRRFRQFADRQGEDRLALAAVSAARSPPFDWETVGALPMPVLVVAGSDDMGAGDPQGLARIFAHAHGVTVAGCDHFSAIPHALTKAAVFDFLDGVLDFEAQI